MQDLKNNKIGRVLAIYAKLMAGQVVKKTEEAKFYSVSERSILRDINDIRDFLVSGMDNNDKKKEPIQYVRLQGGYCMETKKDYLTNHELLQLCKILSDSQVFLKDELDDILNKLVACCASKKNQELLNERIRNRKF